MSGSTEDGKQRVLFLCTHNSARSQMAEGLLRHLGRDRFEAASAGTEATSVRPLATKVMDELGIDISQQQSKVLDQYLDQTFDQVITLCDEAAAACPIFPNAKEQLHWPFPDPSEATGTEEQQRQVYRSVRDAIRQRIEAELLAK
jgi:arsenate reductase